MDGNELTQVTPPAEQIVPPVPGTGQKNPIGDLIDLLKKQKEPEKKPDGDPTQAPAPDQPVDPNKPKTPEQAKPDQKGSEQVPQDKTGTDGKPLDAKPPDVKAMEPKPADSKSTDGQKADDRKDAPLKSATPDLQPPNKSTEILAAPDNSVKSTADTPIQPDKAQESTAPAHRSEYILPSQLQQGLADKTLPHFVLVDEATQKAGKDGQIEDVAVLNYSHSFAAQVKAIVDGSGKVGDKQFDSLWRHLQNDGATSVGTLYPLVKSTTPVYFVKQIEGTKIHPTRL